MLVPKHIVEEWYKRESFVYKNFAYLFANPLWQTRVPSGFSICPYFWLSMLSLLIFRPLALLIRYVFRPMISFCGWPVAWLDKKLRDAINPKLGLGFGLLLGTVCLIVLFALTAVLFSLWRHSFIYPAVAVLFWSVLTVVALTLAVGIYLKAHEADPHPCRVEAWYLLWGLLTAALIISEPLKVWNFLVALFFLAGKVLWWIAHGLGVAANWVWDGVCFLAVVVGGAVWQFLTWGPEWGHGVPYWVIVPVGIFLFGYATKFFLDRVAGVAGKFETAAAESSTADRAALQRSIKVYDWAEQLKSAIRGEETEKMVMDSFHGGTFDYMIRDKFGDTYAALRKENWRGHAYFLRGFVDRVSGEYWKEQVTKLVDAGLEAPRGLSFWVGFNSMRSRHRRLQTVRDATMSQIHNLLALEIIDVDQANRLESRVYVDLQYHENDFLEAALTLVGDPEFKAEYKRIVNLIADLEKSEAKRVQEIQESKWRMACQKFTDGVFDYMTQGIDFLILCLYWCARGIRVPFHFLYIFSAYLWMTTKAKKKGACPYFMFTDSHPARARPYDVIDPQP